jgi:hypothetical protein
MAPQHFTSTVKRQLHVTTLELIVGNRPPLVLTLPLGPQRQTFIEPARTTANQTLGGYYLEEWGPGIKPITLAGHTGFAVKVAYPGAPAMDGYEGFMALVEMFRTYFQVARENSRRKEDEGERLEMNLYLWEEDEAWRVVPSGPDALRRERSAQAPLRFDFSLSLMGVENLRDRPVPLWTGLLAPPGMDVLITAMRESQNWMNNVLNTPIIAGISLNSAAGSIGAALASMREKVSAVRQTIEGGLAGAKAALGPIMSVATEARNLMREVSAALAAGQMAANVALDIARGARHIYCTAKNLGSILMSASGLGTILGQWEAAKRAMVAC